MLCCQRLESTPGVAVGDELDDDGSVRAEFVVDHRFQPSGCLLLKTLPMAST